MDKLLEKIKKSGILTPEELTELESKFVTDVEVEVKTPQGEVAETETPEAPAPLPPTEPVGEPVPTSKMPEAPAPVDDKVAPSPTPAPMKPEVPENLNPEPVEPQPETPLVEGTPAQGGIEPTTVSIGDLDQVKTTINTLESKIRALEDVLSKLSVKEEEPEEDFGISGKGKTGAGGEPYEDKAAQLIKKMGGFSR